VIDVKVLNQTAKLRLNTCWAIGEIMVDNQTTPPKSRLEGPIILLIAISTILAIPVFIIFTMFPGKVAGIVMGALAISFGLSLSLGMMLSLSREKVVFYFLLFLILVLPILFAFSTFYLM